MKRISALALAGFALALPAAADQMSAELDTYRFGATFVRQAAEDAAACAALCAASNQCMAWSQYSPEDAHGAACELKSAPGRPEFRPGYMSGLSGVHEIAPASAAPAGETATDTSAVFGAYQPVSAGMEISELAGGANDTATAGTAWVPASSTQTGEPVSFAPRQVSGVRLGRTVATAGEDEDSARAGF
jgi:hypothetical protein